METNLFRREAAERTAQFAQVMAFGKIAIAHRGVPLVVPPHLDEALHEVLCVRDAQGQGLETMKLTHVREPELGETIGKSLHEVNHPLVAKTLGILEKHGFKVGHEKYAAPACYVMVW